MIKNVMMTMLLMFPFFSMASINDYCQTPDESFVLNDKNFNKYSYKTKMFDKKVNGYTTVNVYVDNETNEVYKCLYTVSNATRDNSHLGFFNEEKFFKHMNLDLGIQNFIKSYKVMPTPKDVKGDLKVVPFQAFKSIDGVDISLERLSGGKDRISNLSKIWIVDKEKQKRIEFVDISPYDLDKF